MESPREISILYRKAGHHNKTQFMKAKPRKNGRTKREFMSKKNIQLDRDYAEFRRMLLFSQKYELLFIEVVKNKNGVFFLWPQGWNFKVQIPESESSDSVPDRISRLKDYYRNLSGALFI